jgi:hypothetical protein
LPPELAGALSNLELGGFRRLDRLRGRLAAAAPAVWTPAMPIDGRTQRGWVLRAVTRVLEDAASPMRMCEIRTKVEAMLGTPVSKCSVMNCLASNSLSERPRFERVGRGLYVVNHG